MLVYSVHTGKTGWFIDNGAICYGPYTREDKAFAAAESLNRQARQRVTAAGSRSEPGGATAGAA